MYGVMNQYWNPSLAQRGQGIYNPLNFMPFSYGWQQKPQLPQPPPQQQQPIKPQYQMSNFPIQQQPNVIGQHNYFSTIRPPWNEGHTKQFLPRGY